mgnify:CR=1 FL=1
MAAFEPLILEQPKKNKQYLFDGMDQKQREEIEEIRLGDRMTH